MEHRQTETCDECRSLFFKDSSQMTNLCPECAQILYGYEGCAHTFVDGRCSRCYWDGSISAFSKAIKDEPGNTDLK